MSNGPPPIAVPQLAVSVAGETLAAATAELDAVEDVLRRLDDGSFERCGICRAPIGSDRLRAEPLLTTCPAHTGPRPPGASGPGADRLEGPVGVLAGDEMLPLGGEQPQG